jgi:truncated hemoglobin YjbI
VGSIYDQIGGTAAVGAAVDDPYRRLLGDPELAAHFGDAFDRMAGHLAGALRELGVGPSQAATMLARVALFRAEVTGA